MLFNSIHFVLFFPAVVIVFFRLNPSLRVYWLVAASCYFYMAFVPAYILVLIFLILLDYTAGRLISASEGGTRRFWLLASIAGNVGVLAFFKYADFVNANIAAVVRALGIDYVEVPLKIALPIGLSFHTFQSMSYVIEVYRGNARAERHLGYYALYVLFFPQMVAGPIERPQNLLRQLRLPTHYDHDRIASGLLRMAVGFFKKLVIADRLAIVVNTVFADPAAHPSWHLWLATYCFAFQIYADFSGYSDIAIGAAQVMGYTLMENFDRPYAARSVSEFWRRWHISLSTWFRDYVYVPLGGNRVGRARRYLNLLIVFILSGLWHGAAWGFVVWGALHGCYVVAEHWTAQGRKRIAAAVGLNRMPRLEGLLKIVVTFHLVAIGWVFFRAANLQDAWTILGRSLAGIGGGFDVGEIGLTGFDLLVGVAAVAGLELFQWLAASRGDGLGWVRRRPVWIRWSVYYALAGVLVLFGKFGSQQFIYFQF